MIPQQVTEALADGRITEHDAFEVSRFAAFLTEAGPPRRGQMMTWRAYAALRRHYPEDPTVVRVETWMQSRCRGPRISVRPKREEQRDGIDE